MKTALQRVAFYIGGFLGPFGTVVVVPMFPELRAEFDASSESVNLGFSLYLFSFAGCLLFSGTIGERLGRRRTVRTTYLVYAAASVLAALAPSLGFFLGARILQGVANAFITPLLLAGLAELVPPESFGREVGIYSSFQALGSGLGPIVGGLAADTSWQYAFIGTAGVALALAALPPAGEPRPEVSAPPIRPLLTPRMLALGVGFLAAAAGPIGVAVIVGIVARDELDLGGTAAGVILFGGAISAMLLGPLWGRLIDHFGAFGAGTRAVAAAGVATAALGLGTTGWLLGLIWIAAGGLVAFVAVVFQAIGATIVPDNRGGALSFLLAFRFVGHALGPILLVPFLDTSVVVTFLAAAALAVVPLGVLLGLQYIDNDHPTRPPFSLPSRSG